MSDLKKKWRIWLTCRFTTYTKKPARHATADKDNVISFDNRELFKVPLKDLIRNGALQLIAVAVEAEVNEIMANVLNVHPKSVQAKAKEALHEI